MAQPFLSPVRPVVALLTDFGSRDGYVGIMKGVMLGIAPDAHLIDITHDIAPQDIALGAWLLATSYRYFPAGTIFTCVVDPGVGSTRYPIALHAGEQFFVAPDNGVLSYVLAQQPLHAAVRLSNAAYHLSTVSATFQGRDIFAPVSAHLAQGVPFSSLGEALEPATLQRLDLKLPIRQEESIAAHIIHIDHFGNLVTSIPLNMVPDLFDLLSVRLAFPARHLVISERRRYFAAQPAQGKDDEPFIYVDSSGYLAVAIRNANAARALGIQTDERVTLILKIV